MPDLIRTFQCRIEHHPALDAMADLYGRLERRLYAEIAKGDANMNALKRSFIADHGITARHFNALRISVEGKIDGVRELLKTQIEETERRIKAQSAKIKALEKAIKRDNDRKKRATLHQRKRRRTILEQRIVALRSRLESPAPGICFGSRKLFNAQFGADYSGHAEWLSDWRNSRSNQILCVGSKDETAGNLTCQGTIAADGSISIKLRLPNALAEPFGKYAHLTGLRFPYGHAQIISALAACARKEGAAVTWRFVRDEKGWRAFVSVNEAYSVRCGDTANGAVGVDVNADHLAVAVVDSQGNPIGFRRIQTTIISTSTERRKAIYGDAAKVIVDTALAHRVPIVLESLDFRKKKSELETSTKPRHARMLSGLAYSQIGQMIRSRATRLGVRVIERNPAYTSLIGDAKFAERYGVSVHLSAALAIARRGMGLSERVPCQPSVTLGNGARGTFPRPARIGRKHVWAQWARVARDKKAALVGRSGSAQRRSSAARSQGPATERSLEQDRLFLGQLINPEPIGGIPIAKPSLELLERRTDRKATYA